MFRVVGDEAKALVVDRDLDGFDQRGLDRLAQSAVASLEPMIARFDPHLRHARLHPDPAVSTVIAWREPGCNR
jgi:hypothetical protein